MEYKNAAQILPEKLLQEVQAYVDGGILYIPKASSRKQWGIVNGSQRFYVTRNWEIKKLFREGTAITELSRQYGLAASTIKKIIYG